MATSHQVQLLAACPASAPGASAVPPMEDEASDPQSQAQREETVRRWTPGRTVGPYHLLRVLGSGTFGMAVLARREGPATSRFERVVCVKVLKATTDAEFVVRMLDEAKLQSALHHDHIVDVYDFKIVEGDFVIEMEFVDGITLTRYLQSFPERKVPRSVACFIVLRVLRGAAWMHAAEDADGTPLRLVHRDIKPGNIFLSKAGQIKIGDFGLVKGRGRQFETRKDTALGTVRYMPPEQCRRGPIDDRADVYAIGVMFYEMLTGRKHPARHHELDDMAALVATLDRERVPVREFAPEVPPRLAALVDRMVAYDAEARPTAAEALVELMDAAPVDIGREELALQARVGDIAHGRPVATVAVTRGAIDEPTDVVGQADESGSGVQRRGAGAAVTSVVEAARTIDTKPRMRRWRAARRAVAGVLLASAVAALLLVATSRRDAPSAPSAERPAAAAAAHKIAPPASQPVPAPPPAAAVLAPPSAEPQSGTGANAADTPSAAPTEDVNDKPEGREREEREHRSDRSARRRQAAAADGNGATPAKGETSIAVQIDGGGMVWVDSEFMGSAPVTVRVTPGEHLVEVGKAGPTEQRRVNVKAGASQPVRFRLSGP
jgi:hypothetical protein